MKAWSAALAGEVVGWPKVNARSFFGFTALYRGDKMFAALPRTRGWETANSLAFKLETRAPVASASVTNDSRVRNWSKPMQKARWFIFELSSDAEGSQKEEIPVVAIHLKSGSHPHTMNSNERSNYYLVSFMGSTSTATRVSARPHRALTVPATRYDRRLAEIIAHAAEVFCKKGYEGASMRDLSRESGMSLAGLYYYFESKERLLYLIQKHAFTTIVKRLKARLEGVINPEERIRIFILNHLEYFLANQAAMKVLSHEAEVLKNGFAAEVAAIKREYYRICVGLLDELKREGDLQFSTRIAVLSLFGMMNWIYTWHNPRVDADAVSIAREMGDVFLRGVMAGNKRRDGR